MESTKMSQPNVIIILADDLGFSDIAPFGGEIDTPALQRLADRGIRMSSFYVTPRCSPSRASVLTGKHPHSVGIGVLTTDNRPTGYPGSLSTEVPTLAERLKARGYATGVFGKWHLANEVKTPAETWPTRRGFDEFRGILPGASSFYQPPLMQGESRIPADQMPDDYYFTDDISENGADFIRRHSSDDEPYFLFLTYTAPHWPLHAAEADIAKYRERFSEGWDGVREERLNRLQEAGIIPAVDVLPPSQTLPDWEEQSKQWQIERMAVYSAQVESLDRGIGRILDAVAQSGAEDDTMVLFFSDNGGCSEELPAGFNFFAEDVAPRTTPSGAPVKFGNDPDVMPGPIDTYQSYGEDWATVSNTPFRKWKRWVHEGGISTPFIASWPGGGVPTGGTVSHNLGHITDIVPTVLGALDGLDADVDVDGNSLLSVWREPQSPSSERTLFWEHVGNAAIRKGKFKLVREWGTPWELYDIVMDRTESVDLAAEHPDVVAELEAEYETWASTHKVIPWQNILDDHAARGLHPMQAMG